MRLVKCCGAYVVASIAHVVLWRQAAPSSDCSADESGSITTNRANLFDHRASFKSNLSDTDVMFLNVSVSVSLPASRFYSTHRQTASAIGILYQNSSGSLSCP